MVNKALFTSLNQKWRTPSAIYAQLDHEFLFDFDPCPEDPDFDGLNCEWGRCNFINPPYNRIKDWVAKTHQEWEKGKTCVLLIPSRADTIWWHSYIMRATEIRFLKGRLHFDDARTKKAPFPSAVVIFKAKVVAR